VEGCLRKPPARGETGAEALWKAIVDSDHVEHASLQVPIALVV
jgi:hypothetical protein